MLDLNSKINFHERAWWDLKYCRKITTGLTRCLLWLLECFFNFLDCCKIVSKMSQIISSWSVLNIFSLNLYTVEFEPSLSISHWTIFVTQIYSECALDDLYIYWMTFVWPLEQFELLLNIYHKNYIFNEKYS